MEYKMNVELQDLKVSDSIGHIVNRVAISMRKNLTAMFKEKGVDLTPEEFAILHTLWESDGMLQTEITEKTLKDKTRVTRLLGSLAEKALIVKKTHENDRRNLRIFLTEKGSSLRSKIMPIVSMLMEQASDQVPQSDFDTTVRTLRKVLCNLNSRSLHMEAEAANDGIAGEE